MLGLKLNHVSKRGHWDQIIPVEHGQHHRCWCPDSLRRQDISTYDIDYVV